MGDSELRDRVTNCLLGLTGLFLKTAEEFVLLAFFEKEIVIGEIGILLLQLALGFVPSAFHFEFGHGRSGLVVASSSD